MKIVTVDNTKGMEKQVREHMKPLYGVKLDAVHGMRRVSSSLAPANPMAGLCGYFHERHWLTFILKYVWGVVGPGCNLFEVICWIQPNSVIILGLQCRKTGIKQFVMHCGL